LPVGGHADRGPALYAVSTSGDRIAAEDLYQYAQHYFRIMNAVNEGHQHCVMPPTVAANLETKRAEEDGSEMAGPVHTSLSNRQPYSAHRVEHGAGRHPDGDEFLDRLALVVLVDNVPLRFISDYPSSANLTLGARPATPRLRRSARNDTTNGCHCEVRSDEAKIVVLCPGTR
jgi:hypothetical protein